MATESEQSRQRRHACANAAYLMREVEAEAFPEGWNAAIEQLLVFSLPDHGIEVDSRPDADEHTLVQCLTAALAPNAIVQPMELVRRAQAYRTHSAELARIRAELMRESHDGRPIDHEISDEIVTAIGDAVTVIVDGLNAAASALGKVRDR